MEKIISINLAGRVIAIEDSAYTSLKAYIESLHRYFAGEEGGDEIIADIESRIAELLHEKIKGGSAAITDADVAAVIASMGRVEDFAAQDEAADGARSERKSAGSRGTGRFRRDKNDKIAGGVCAGLAAYLNVDPALVRIVFTLLTLGIWGFGFVLYIVLWIFVPAAEVPRYSGRRLYRNADDKWLGGVCSGLAAYFDKETWIFRLVFAAPFLLGGLSGSMHAIFHSSLFFGSLSGTIVLIYIVLWIVLPVAVTEFQKMEMRGEKIDIASIRDNVYADLKDRTAGFRDDVSESAAKLRSRGRAFATEARDAAGPIASRGAQVLGGLLKAFFIFIGSCIAFALFMGLIGYFFGGFSGLVNDFILQTPTQRSLAWITVLLLLGVPMLALLTGIVRRITRARAGGAYFRMGYALLWVAGIVCAGALAASVGDEFHRHEKVVREIPIAQPRSGRLVLSVPGDAIENRHGLFGMHWDNRGWDLSDNEYRSSNVYISATLSQDSQYHVLLTRWSGGKNAQEARWRADAVSYDVQNARGTDSVLQLGNGYSITKAQGYRGQEVMLEVQVPAGKRLYFDESVEDKLSTGPRIHYTGFRTDRRRQQSGRRSWTDYLAAGVDYKMGADGTLTDVAGRKADGNYAYSAAASGDKRELVIDSLQRAMDALEQRKEALQDEEDNDDDE